jgi:hypothetical protein
MKDKDLPKINMSREELVAKHVELDAFLKAENRKKFPDSTQQRRLKRLKAMYKIRIDGLEPKPPFKVSAEVVSLPEREKRPETSSLENSSVMRRAVNG